MHTFMNNTSKHYLVMHDSEYRDLLGSAGPGIGVGVVLPGRGAGGVGVKIGVQ